ncbi:ATP-binding protein [Lacimicrobium sp. SS2-24]|uniref:ATP-binding protein n=1 Tax=Lacimicrobium sp. SS2-24 TaxID=2005569 RepID=UPI000B4B9820|nr:ATP-binding protein [Lacimicrobium sp. SS2-24]
MSSVRRFLVLVLLAVITLVIFLAASQSYRNTLSASSTLFDRQLLAVADALNGLPLPTESALPDAPNVMTSDGEFIFQIWFHDRLLLTTSGLQAAPLTSRTSGVREENLQGQRWQVLAQYYPATGYWVMVAQPLHHRIELSEEMILATLMPLALSLPLLALLISLAVRQGLSPLRQLTGELETKRADDLSPLHLTYQQEELKPVVATINSLLQRLQQSFERERRFASDAAHELRTPLSVLKINLHNLEKELEHTPENLLLLKQGVERMSHVVDQILMLNRTNPEHFSVQFKKVDLYKLCQQVITELYPQIAQKQQQISLHGQAAVLPGDEFSLRLLLQNLLTNANKYSPVKSQIDITVSATTEGTELIVADSGPGLSEAEYARVFDRFYRVGGDRHQSGVPGCGLGLAIVEHVVNLYHGRITLGHSEALGGLQVRVVFPLGGEDD